MITLSFIQGLSWNAYEPTVVYLKGPLRSEHFPLPSLPLQRWLRLCWTISGMRSLKCSFGKTKKLQLYSTAPTRRVHQKKTHRKNTETCIMRCIVLFENSKKTWNIWNDFFRMPRPSFIPHKWQMSRPSFTFLGFIGWSFDTPKANQRP